MFVLNITQNLFSPQIADTKDFLLLFLKNVETWGKTKQNRTKSWWKTYTCDLEGKQVTDKQERQLIAGPNSNIYACYLLSFHKGKKAYSCLCTVTSPFVA